jgi:hypothetical protein
MVSGYINNDGGQADQLHSRSNQRAGTVETLTSAPPAQTDTTVGGDDAKHPPDRRPRHHKLVTIGLLAIACLAAMFIVGAPAEAATSGRCYYNSSRTCYPYMSTDWVAWASPTSQGANYWTIKKGTRVDMRCWTTGATRLSTSKWFYVKSLSYPYTQGYVPANAVADQISVGRC